MIKVKKGELYSSLHYRLLIFFFCNSLDKYLAIEKKNLCCKTTCTDKI